MTCKMTLDVKDLQKHIKDDFVSRGEIINGNTLKLTREQGGTVEVTLPEGQKITSFDLVNRGGKNVLELKTSDSKTFTAYLPETQQAADKHITAFEVNTRDSETSLTIRRSDGENFVVKLPQQGGGGGTDLHVTGFDYNQEVIGGVPFYHKLIITRSDGKTFEAKIPIRPKGEGGPDKYLEELTTDTPPSETSFRANAGRFYFTKNVEVTGRLNSGTEIKSKQPWNKLYWSEADTTDPSHATEKRPIMDIFATDGGQSLSVVRDDASTNTIRLQTGGGAGGTDKFVTGINSTIENGDTRTEGTVSYSKATITARLNDGTSVSTKLPFEIAFNTRTGEQIFPSASGTPSEVVKSVTHYNDKRALHITYVDGSANDVNLPDSWFEKAKDGDDKDKFVTVAQYNVLAANLAQLSWSAAIPHESLHLPQEFINNFYANLLEISTNQDGNPVSWRVTDRSELIKKYWNNATVYPYQIISLFQPGDTEGFNATHLHTPHPFLHAYVPSIDPPPGSPAGSTRNGTHAIDIFRYMWGGGLTQKQLAYSGTVYMSTPFAGDPQRELPVGMYSAVFPIGMLNPPQKHAPSNYASQLPNMLLYRVRKCFAEENPATIPPELIFNTSAQISPHDITPHF